MHETLIVIFFSWAFPVHTTFGDLGPFLKVIEFEVEKKGGGVFFSFLSF